MEYPDFFARFYDLIYHSVRDTTDHEYFLNKMMMAGGPVLEMGVGTGRLFKDALDRNVDVYGVDISRAMLWVLKEKISEDKHHRVKLHDISNPFDDKKYNLIVAPFRVFMHLTAVEQQVHVLNNVYNALRPGGKFIFDLFVPNLKMLHEGLDQVTDFQGEYAPGMKVKRVVSMQADIINQISHITFTLIWDEDGREIRKDWHTELRLFFRYEIEHLISKSRLKLERIYGDFQENDLNKDSKEFIVVCSKRK